MGAPCNLQTTCQGAAGRRGDNGGDSGFRHGRNSFASFVSFGIVRRTPPPRTLRTKTNPPRPPKPRSAAADGQYNSGHRSTAPERNGVSAARPVRPELLAPAGDWDALRAAVANGA